MSLIFRVSTGREPEPPGLRGVIPKRLLVMLLVTVGGSTSGLLVSCKHCTVTPPPSALLFNHKAVDNPPMLSLAIPDAEKERLRALPVVDIHSHMFNALSLPLEQIARGRIREYATPPILTDIVTDILVDAIIGRTIENQEPSYQIYAAKAPPRRSGSIAQQIGVTTASVENVRRANPALLSRRAAPASLPDPAVGAELDNDENWIKFSDAVFGLKEPTPDGNKMLPSVRAQSKIVAFLRTLTSADQTVRNEAQAAFSGQVQLFVHHTMDMGKTYAQAADGERFRDFVGWQLKRAKTLDEVPESAGRFLHFVAFNPFNAEKKEPADGWANSVAITRVKDAIAQGAWGVKYYPPAGYRASYNAIPTKPTDAILAEQWESRYGILNADDLDKLNYALFYYCATEGIPVFAHCANGEFQAANCYGANMAHPSYYRKILEDLAKEGKTLRLCLGHAGGADFWFGGDRDANGTWGEQVYELCTRFPEVYCEVGILAEVTDATKQAEFTRRLTALYALPTPAERYPFREKLIYGTDWFMPDAAGAMEQFLDDYRKVFLSNTVLANSYRDFFAGNALRYLRVEEKLKDPQLNPSSKLRNNLADLLQKTGTHQRND